MRTLYAVILLLVTTTAKADSYPTIDYICNTNSDAMLQLLCSKHRPVLYGFMNSFLNRLINADSEDKINAVVDEKYVWVGNYVNCHARQNNSDKARCALDAIKRVEPELLEVDHQDMSTNESAFKAVSIILKSKETSVNSCLYQNIAYFDDRVSPAQEIAKVARPKCMKKAFEYFVFSSVTNQLGNIADISPAPLTQIQDIANTTYSEDRVTALVIELRAKQREARK